MALSEKQKAAHRLAAEYLYFLSQQEAVLNRMLERKLKEMEPKLEQMIEKRIEEHCSS